MQTGTVVLGRSEFDMLCQKLTGLEQSIAELRKELGRDSRVLDPALGGVSDHTDLHGYHHKNASVSRDLASISTVADHRQGSITHFGAGSIPTMLHALKSPGDDTTQRELREQLNKSMMPLFALDGDTATYPFIDLWGLPHASQARVNELAKVLPDDQETLALIRNYKSLAYIMFPGVAHLERFEAEVHDFLVTRAAKVGSIEGITEQMIYGKSYYWLGLLFAVLASGAQSSTMPRKQRELTSQVYVCCAMECCRITNFLSRSNTETIETLLIIQNVLSNNMSAGTAWTMLGLTIRLAQGQGFHQPCGPGVTAAHSFKRSRVWWAIIWQDSMLSIIYDRAGSEHLVCEKAMPMPMHYGEVSSYQQAMFKLAKVTLDIMRDRGLYPNSHGHTLCTAIESHHKEIVSIVSSAADYLQDSRHCESTQDYIEYWGLYLHSSFVVSELCRPAVNPARGADAHRELCIHSLVNTVDAYLGLQSVTAYARQSWAAIHRALSSALLLGILGEHNRNSRARHLLANLVSTMQEMTTSIDPAEMAAPLQRGINALQKLNLSGSTTDASQHTSNASKVDNALISAPQPYTEGDDFSPHAILNSILWGTVGPGDNPTALPMPW